MAAWPTAAFAQAKKPIREQLPLEARGHWDAGVALAQKGTPQGWDGARTSFKAAYDISKNPRVLFNVGIAEKELGKYPAAIDTFQRELREGKGQLTAADEAEVKQVIAGLEKLVATVTLDLNEKDAEVYVDDDRIDATKLGGPITVTGGTRKFRASKPGFLDAVETVTVVGGSSDKVVKLKLEPTVRRARVNVSVVGPSNAIVKIDKKEVGPAPYAGMVAVTAEPHEFSAEAPGYVPATQTAVVKDGEVLNLTLQLAVEQEKGKLVIVAKPEGSTIEIDGKYAGTSKWEGPVDARIHQVVVKRQGYYTWNYDVDVPRGGERAVTASLNEDRNTSYVPWVVGTIVIGAAIVVGVVLLATPPDEKEVRGNLGPGLVGTQSMPGFRF